MRGLVQRLSVFLLAVSFAASGVAVRQCDAAQHTIAPVAVAQTVAADHAHHSHSAHDGAHTHRVEGATVHQHGAGGAGPLADDYMCAKCCGTCTLVTAVTPDAQVAVIFSVSPASFSDKPEHLAGTTMKVDPGIPKSIS